MNPILDDLSAMGPAQSGRQRSGKCIVARWIEALPDQERAHVQEAIASKYPVKFVHKVIATRYPNAGFVYDTFNRHVSTFKNGEERCACRL